MIMYEKDLFMIKPKGINNGKLKVFYPTNILIKLYLAALTA